ncbi:16S rRNA pseudouridine516 synthase [Paenibacillus shirakamiensis]|uniref:Pseudouridine synthase n=1 Tax=Paenibacillus shirakamiensis TaxID=1265935 RepID=A0ABS4JJH8_9BACL|nr:pseudouridine synthase [Paenibacillus shirakamiensis]MBP2001265.1 16S rRNA pseudouridine516 synthase [Paenibacillus shirakamiensis]
MANSKGKKTQRIDKILGHLGKGSRSDLKKMVKQGRITLNGQVLKDSGAQADPYIDQIEVDGEAIFYREFVYIMLHKPAGVVSATEDQRDRTVIDLLPEQYKCFELFPVGRLDKDTEGLLLLTNDGQLAHDLLSPRKHVPKTYFAKVEGHVGDREAQRFVDGVTLDDGYKTLPAHLQVLQHVEKDDRKLSLIELTISEGKFHQVKRMFEAVDSKVLFLKRISMGSLALDEELPLGASRELHPEELASLMNRDIL